MAGANVITILHVVSLTIGSCAYVHCVGSQQINNICDGSRHNNNTFNNVILIACLVYIILHSTITSDVLFTVELSRVLVTTHVYVPA